ncbi:MAG: diadenosine tetraphosphate hydrolase [bacterium]|nr:diadenosine tetraphosphate hydrolase [bacterium]
MLFSSNEFKVLKTKYWDLHQDWEVSIPGFLVLAPNRKGVKSIADFTDEELEEFGILLRKIRQGMQEVLGIKEVYFFQNEDSGHFHLWIFPRFDWMERFGRKIESVRPIIEYAKKNMATEEVKNQVKEYVIKMREWISF